VIEMNKLKCTSRFPRTFYKNGRNFTNWYQRWTILDEKGNFVKFWDIGDSTHLATFLSNLLGHRESYPVDESRCKIFATIFEHTNRWKLFEDAWHILNKKGSKQALKFLEDKFSVIRLADKLKVNQNG